MKREKNVTVRSRAAVAKKMNRVWTFNIAGLEFRAASIKTVTDSYDAMEIMGLMLDAQKELHAEVGRGEVLA